MLRPRSLTADVPTHGGLRAVRRPGSATTSDYTLETATCRYDLSVSIRTPDADGVSRPTPVSRLFSVVRPPPAP